MSGCFLHVIHISSHSNTVTDSYLVTSSKHVNINTILTEAGSSLDKIVKTTVWMVSGNEFSILNKVYAEFFPHHAPARSTPQVTPFPAGILVSVECIAQV